MYDFFIYGVAFVAGFQTFSNLDDKKFHNVNITVTKGTMNFAGFVFYLSPDDKTVDDAILGFDPPKSKGSSPAGAIAGGVVDGLAVIAILVACIVCFRRRRSMYTDTKGLVNLHPDPPSVERGATATSSRDDTQLRPYPYEQRSEPVMTKTSALPACTGTAQLLLLHSLHRQVLIPPRPLGTRLSQDLKGQIRTPG
jgi:hypothetical protein